MGVRSNCLLWAIGMWHAFGGSIRVVRIRGTWVPRFIWHSGDRFYFWRPVAPKAGWRAYIHKLWYEGAVTECNQHGVPANKHRKLQIYRDPVTGRFVSRH